MTIKRRLKLRFERRTGIRVYRGTLPRGLDGLLDVRRELPELRVDVVFDVGANVGQSTARFLVGFPRAEIYAFEPVTSAFARLEAAFANEPRVQCLPVALGRTAGGGTVRVGDHLTMGSLLPALTDEPVSGTGFVERVDVDTLDAFSARQGVERIGYLKIDTEGYDLEVLAGAERMLAAHRIDLVEVEAGMNPENQRHVPMAALKEHLETCGYRLLGIYEQVPEWPTGEPYLRRTNLLFLSTTMLDRRRDAKGTAGARGDASAGGGRG